MEKDLIILILLFIILLLIITVVILGTKNKGLIGPNTELEIVEAKIGYESRSAKTAYGILPIEDRSVVYDYPIRSTFVGYVINGKYRIIGVVGENLSDIDDKGEDPFADEFFTANKEHFRAWLRTFMDIPDAEKEMMVDNDEAFDNIVEHLSG